MVSYDFPPSSIGIWRTLKFCRYLPEFGWQPAVLTVRPVRSPRQDEGPLSELPEGTEVRRTGSADPHRLAWLLGRKGSGGAGGSGGPATSATWRPVFEFLRSWVFIPDDRIGWMPFAVREGRGWLREQKFDAVYTTSTPHTAHLVGERLAREAGLPLLADFRDVWVGNYLTYRPATAWQDRRQRALEARVVRRAGRVVSATEPITQDFIERYSAEPRGKFLTITNGFDDSDFVPDGAHHDPSVYTITYAGTLFGATSPVPFLRAVRLLLRQRPEWREVLRLRFLGSMIEPYRETIRKFGLGDITRVEPYLPHSEALRAMQAADMLLLIVADQPGSHIMLTQKVFEYAAARRPVLGLVPEGAARDFLSEIGEGRIAPPSAIRHIAREIDIALTRWREHGREVLPPNPRLAKYHRRELTRRLAEALEGLG